MCNTNYISNILATTPSYKTNVIQVSMKRSDGELFIANIDVLTTDVADKVKKLINYFEELRTCSCTKHTVCEKHSELRKV